MKFLRFYLFFCTVFAFANNKIVFFTQQDTTINIRQTTDTPSHSLSTSSTDSHSISSPVVVVTEDTIRPKVYRKRRQIINQEDSLRIDSLRQDSLMKSLRLQDSLHTIDTANLLSESNLYSLIPFYINKMEPYQHVDRYIGEKRMKTSELDNIYIYVYFFLLFLAICINIFQTLNKNRYAKNTTLKYDIRRLSSINIYFHSIIVLLEILLSVGLAIFLNLYAQIFYNQIQNFTELIHFALLTTLACLVFFIGKHILTYTIQVLFLGKQNRFLVIYFYKTLLIHFASLLYITTCVVFFVDDPVSKIYIIKTAIGIGIILYLYALFNILKNLSRVNLSTLISVCIYLITIEIIPYLLLFKFLYTYHFFIQ